MSDAPVAIAAVASALCAWWGGSPRAIVGLGLVLAVGSAMLHFLGHVAEGRARVPQRGGRVAGRSHKVLAASHKAAVALPKPGAGAVLVGCALVALVGLRVQQDMGSLERPPPGRISGVAELASDPTTSHFGTSVTVVLEGSRWKAEIPRSSESVVRGALMGERFSVEGTTRPLNPAFRGWQISQHLAGSLAVTDIRPAGDPHLWFRVANGFHRTLASGARSLTDDQRSLYMGLIVGDDRDQPPLSQHQFRASGLAHLSAVSGQNLVFVFAVLHPLSSRLSLRTRWILLGFATVLFVLVTRAEPSVLRAATMAAFALGASLAGRRATGIRLLSLCVLALLLADPLLVHSVGFQLSLGATAGLILLSHPLACAIPAPQWLALPIAVTLAAQAGALLPLTANFGVVSIVSVPANLLAEPAAAGVMTMGLTGGFLAGLVRHPFDAALQFPVGLLVSWIDGVAATASRIAVPPLGLVGWVAIAVSVFIAWVLWRRRGIDSIGRCVGVIAAAGVVLLRPSAPGEHLPVAGGVAGIDSCGGSILVLEKGDGVPAVEDLWKLGIFRVDTVVGDGFPVDGTVAEQLRARRVIQAESSQLRTDALCSFGA